MDLSKLQGRDYVLILDKSGSMNETDTTSGVSRWKYAQESAQAIASKVHEYDPDGITVIPFAGTFKTYENTTPAKLKEVWAENEPMGGTTLAPVLDSVFNAYLARKKAGSAKPNGEMVIVVTDGQPSDEAAVMKSIVNFGNKLDTGDDEYGIAFFQVGRDAQATAFLQRLDDDLVGKHGAKHDIVDAKTIDEVEKIGLTEALIAALTD